MFAAFPQPKTNRRKTVVSFVASRTWFTVVIFANIEVFSVFVSSCLAQQSQHSLVITEIMASPIGLDETFEWIEVYNAGTVTLQLSDFKLREMGVMHSISPLSVDPRGFAIIANDRDCFVQRYTNLLAITADSTFSLSDAGELLEIVLGTNYPAGLVDAVSYDNETFPPTAEGRSLHLDLPAMPNVYVNDNGTNWINAESTDGISFETAGEWSNPGTAAWCRPSIGRMMIFIR